MEHDADSELVDAFEPDKPLHTPPPKARYGWGVMNIWDNIKGFYYQMNTATLSGAIDVVVVKQKDGTYVSSPFHVRFGKLGVLHAKERVVDIRINDEPVDLRMKLGQAGEAFFVEETSADDKVPLHLATSPINASGSELLVKAASGGVIGEEDTGFYPISQTVDSSPDRTPPDKDSPSNEVAASIPVFSAGAEFESDDIFTMDDQRVGAENGFAKQSSLKAQDTNGENATTISINDAQPSASVSQSFSLPHLTRTRRALSDKQPCMIESPTNLTPVGEPSPLSDSELSTPVNETHNKQISGWSWGELPAVTVPPSSSSDTLNREKIANKPATTSDAEKPAPSTTAAAADSTLKGLKQDGIYLSELADLDKEVAALYLAKQNSSNSVDKEQLANDDQLHPHNVDNEDAESGKGPSIPQSPAMGQACCQPIPPSDEDDRSPLPTVQLSLCGFQKDSLTDEKFFQHIVTFDKLCEAPDQLLSNPDLVLRVGDNYYNWPTAAPMMLAFMVYNRPLTQDTVKKLMKQHMPRKRRSGFSAWRSWWRRQDSDDAMAVPVASAAADEVLSETSSHTSPVTSTQNSPSKNQRLPVRFVKSEDELADISSGDEELLGRASLQQPHLPRSQSDVGLQLMAQNVDVGSSSSISNFRKTLRLTSDQIEALNLHDGVNQVEFSVVTALQGTARAFCNLFLWNWDDKVVVSDIDGTITRSDVFGQIFPILGKDWSQSGVAKLYNRIHRNGYRFLYLSARAIGQASITRNFLSSVVQEDALMLPAGPVMLSPSSLVNAFHQEVIEKTPEIFKIGCLKDVSSLFEKPPFYAGFGNKINDVRTYRAVGVAASRIFTINPKGDVRHDLTHTYQTSYNSLAEICDLVFPDMTSVKRHPPDGSDYTDFMYWRSPVVSFEDETKSTKTVLNSK